MTILLHQIYEFLVSPQHQTTVVTANNYVSLLALEEGGKQANPLSNKEKS